MKGKDRSMAAQGGFSLVELLVVVGIIVVLGGIALPNIYTYMRQARIRAGMREVSGAIQTARTRAVLKNINNGVVFAIENTNPANTYWIHVEDDQAVPKTTSQQMPLDLAVTGAIGCLRASSSRARRSARRRRRPRSGTTPSSTSSASTGWARRAIRTSPPAPGWRSRTARS
jgi:prepilin-type N-terminal cleavage/methylation domain-containing protein